MYNVGTRRLVCNRCIVRAINVGNWHDTYTAMRRIAVGHALGLVAQVVQLGKECEALRAKSSPAGVTEKLRPWRWRSSKPSSPSSALTCCDTADWLTMHLSAARVNDPVSTTAHRYWIWRSSTSSPRDESSTSPMIARDCAARMLERPRRMLKQPLQDVPF